MKKNIFFLLLLCSLSVSQTQNFIMQGNNILTRFSNFGIYNARPGTAGFEWPKGTGKTAVFSSGLSVAAYVNGSLREAMASYKGEYIPGYCSNSIYHTDGRFKIYNVSKGDNYINNPDWMNWGLMIPFGAPYIDVDHNGSYNYFIDTPGVRNAAQTIFICLTDGDPQSHMVNEGFGGGTPPLFAEVHLTAWCYNNPGYEDMLFQKWEVINRNTYRWDSTYFSVFNDFDLGSSDDDYSGCDTTKNLVYCYNADNDDSGPAWSYGLNPPAVGLSFLECSSPGSKLLSAVNISNIGGGPNCERDPNGEPFAAYHFMKGIKKDGTPWVIPNTSPPQITKFLYSGDPEDSAGWTERKGSILNCGGYLTGTYIAINPLGDRRSVASFGRENFSLNKNDTFRITAAQLIARGTSNLNSVTKLKLLTDKAHELCQNGFVIGISPISKEIPVKFNLYQNYPNPFNPVTKFKFDIPKAENVVLKIYDALGKEISSIMNEKLNPGAYSVDWDASAYPSGVYFYQLITGSFTETKKMILVK